jgi:menaquinone-dependent protoporphyrinogen oxidase
MGRILIVYSTTDGHTRRICEYLGALIESGADRVTLAAIENADAVDLSSFDRIVVGAAIRYGRHKRLVHDFVQAHAGILEAKPAAFFSVNLVARKSDKNRPETNPYVQQFLRQVRWRPREVDVFAGKLDYPRYRLLDRMVIRLIMLVTGGPTDTSAVVEFTDWQRVDAFARRVAAMR